MAIVLMVCSLWMLVAVVFFMSALRHHELVRTVTAAVGLVISISLVIGVLLQISKGR